MMKFLLSAAAYVVANAIGLLLAVLLLPGFTINFSSFLIAVLIFSLVEAVALPLLTKMSTGYAAQLAGGVALIAVALGLLVTDWLTTAMQIGGVSNWLAATLLVWLGSLIAGLALPVFVFKRLRAPSEKAN